MADAGAARVTNVCTQALTEVGDSRLTDILDGSPLSLLCLDHFTDARREALVLAPWAFATVRVALARSPHSPAFRWTYQYLLPAQPHCLKVLETSEGKDALFEIGFHPQDGPILWSHAASLGVTYVGDITDLDQWEPLAIQVLVALLASKLAKALSGQTALADAKRKEALELVALAGAPGAREGNPAQGYAAFDPLLVSEPVAVANGALSLVGAKHLHTFYDDSDEGFQVQTHWTTSRDMTLELHPWNFATCRAQLTASPHPPVHGWRYMYALHTQPYCLTVVATDQGNGARFAIEHHPQEGRVLVSKETTVGIVYIGRVVDMNRWSALAVQVFKYVLASNLATKLSQAPGKSQQLLQAAFGLLPVARQKDGQEGTPMVVRPNRLLVSSRQRTGGGSAYVGIRTYLP